VTCWQKAVAIEKVGLYIPGGTAPLFSTVLMLAVPARIAGCKEIVLCTPPGRDGKVHPAVLFAAKVAGVNRIFKAGGIQAIAAMAYGTESVPKVYKIFGPGNQYVTAAKQQVSLRDVAIDMPAGPSEVEVLADETANPVFVAADLLSQAEHGVDSQAMLITTSEKLMKEVEYEVQRQLALLPRWEIAEKSLASSKLILVRDMDEAIALTNEYAPEHLIIETKDYMELAERIVNAGSLTKINLLFDNDFSAIFHLVSKANWRCTSYSTSFINFSEVVISIAFLSTQLSAAAAALGWMIIEWKRHGKPTTLGRKNQNTSRKSGIYMK
jgi:histidinol dehydrogenase